ncbi:MAG: hypothetical protein H0X45_12870 [Planctomycetes bacterium]|nr:hypothetical protein [Planctomycetota bacterium]
MSDGAADRAGCSLWLEDASSWGCGMGNLGRAAYQTGRSIQLLSSAADRLRRLGRVDVEQRFSKNTWRSMRVVERRSREHDAWLAAAGADE